MLVRKGFNRTKLVATTSPSSYGLPPLLKRRGKTERVKFVRKGFNPNKVGSDNLSVKLWLATSP